MDIVQILSAAGIGGIFASLLTTFIQSWLSRRSQVEIRNFQEKKEAYIGLLEAYRRACLNSGAEEVNNFAYWAVRCDLVATPAIRGAIGKLKTDNYELQFQEFEKLTNLMRQDLSIAG